MTPLRLLTRQDEAELRAFLLRDPLYNLFMIGDLEMLGMGSDGLHYWGQFASGGALVAVAMRYRVGWCFYGTDAPVSAEFARLVDAFPESRVINGHPAQVEPVVARLTRHRVDELRRSFYCRLPLDAHLPSPAWPTRMATGADVPALAALYATAGMMRRDADGIRRTLAHGRIAVTEIDGQLVSAALTTVETSRAAMIGGVFTPEPLRNRGYASAAMARLCAELVAQARQPCLFYDNPAAGTIYRRLGFEDIGPWHLVLLKQANR